MRFCFKFGRGIQLRSFCYIYIFYFVFKIPSTLVTHNGNSLPLLFAHVKIVVFINEDDEVKHVNYYSPVLCKYFISKLKANIGVTNRIFNINIEHIGMSSEKKSGRELFEIFFKRIVHVYITHLLKKICSAILVVLK